MLFWIVLVFVAAAATVGLLYRMIRVRYLDRWLAAYFRQRRSFPDFSREIHVLLCFADHYEPKAHNVDREHGIRRVETWLDLYPQRFGAFRDSDGKPPRYSFFFPIEEYEPEYLDALAQLCRAGYGEVEIHLHHDRDTADALRQRLAEFRDLLVNRHGLLSRHRDTGAVQYGFIHGNWALNNCRPDGAWCGVDNEIEILLETGCYADFTFPSAPHPTQPPIINRIYYARNLPGRPASHEIAIPAGEEGADSLMLVQGPLTLDWSRRKYGFIPRIENACLQETQPPSIERLKHWLSAGIQMPNKPTWYFVKLHAHGAPEEAHRALLGEPMLKFHRDLADLARKHPNFKYHYVTAREMYNLAKAAEAGFQGTVDEARDFVLLSNLPSESTDRRSSAPSARVSSGS